MNLKTYSAPTMAEALSKVKSDLGRSAVIVGTRTFKAGGWLGLGARTLVEITASGNRQLASGVTADRRLETGGTVPRRLEQRALGRSGPRSPAPAVARALDGAGAVHEDRPSPSAAVRQELQDIKSMVQELARQQGPQQVSDLPEQLRQAYLKLIQNQVAEELAGRFIRNIGSRYPGQNPIPAEQIQELLLQQMIRLLGSGCSINTEDVAGCKVVALVGPTGVGKTTTVAKLAAHFRLKQGKKVGLLTLDTYRVAAVEQLKTYAQIIDVPLEVALTPQEAQQAVGRLKHCDLVFIDTAGRSPFDRIQINELKQFLEAVQPHETHLVLTCNTSDQVLRQVAEHFSPLGINRLIVSKLDETVGLGVLLGVMQQVNAQLSYVTTGQDVPDDIEVSDGRRLAQMILRPGGAAN